MDGRYLVRRWWLVPLTLVVTGGSIAVNVGEPVPIVLGALSALVLFGIGRSPALVLGHGLLVSAYFLAGGDNGPVFFTVPVATLLAALAGEVRRWLPYVVASGVAIWAGLLVRGVRDDVLDVSAWQSFGIGAFVAAAAAIGTVARTRRAALRDRQGRAAADEKLRMAQDLHDGVGHGLAVIAMQAGVALHVLDQDPVKARASLEAIRDTSREALEALRSELAAISGTAPRRPAPGLADLPALLDRVRAAGLRIESALVPTESGHIPVETGLVPGDKSGFGGDKSGFDVDVVSRTVGEVAYVVVQEALTNVLRHSGATTATIGWTVRDGVLVLAVRDDGRGGALSDDGQDEGMGIGGMRTRVTRLGGTLRAGPLPGGGFEVVAELPA